MFDDYSNLRPLKGIAEILAKDSNWGPLYDLEQLARNEIKVSAVTYVISRMHHISFSVLTVLLYFSYMEDMYVILLSRTAPVIHSCQVCGL